MKSKTCGVIFTGIVAVTGLTALHKHWIKQLHDPRFENNAVLETENPITEIYNHAIARENSAKQFCGTEALVESLAMARDNRTPTEATRANPLAAANRTLMEENKF